MGERRKKDDRRRRDTVWATTQERILLTGSLEGSLQLILTEIDVASEPLKHPEASKLHQCQRTRKCEKENLNATSVMRGRTRLRAGGSD